MGNREMTRQVKTFDYRCQSCKFDWSYLINEYPMIAEDFLFCPHCGTELPRASVWKAESDIGTLHEVPLTTNKILWNAIIPVHKRKSYMAKIVGRQTSGQFKGGLDRQFLFGTYIDGQRAFNLNGVNIGDIIEVSGWMHGDKRRQYIVVVAFSPQQFFFHKILEKDVAAVYPPLEREL